MPEKRKKRNRTWVPRPSPEAKAAILAAVRFALADDALAGYGVSIRQINCGLSYSSLRNYLVHLVRAGDLVRVASGVYALPVRRA